MPPKSVHYYFNTVCIVYILCHIIIFFLLKKFLNCVNITHICSRIVIVNKHSQTNDSFELKPFMIKSKIAVSFVTTLLYQCKILHCNSILKVSLLKASSHYLRQQLQQINQSFFTDIFSLITKQHFFLAPCLCSGQSRKKERYFDDFYFSSKPVNYQL